MSWMQGEVIKCVHYMRQQNITVNGDDNQTGKEIDGGELRVGCRVDYMVHFHLE